ncbi:MAG: hypothetical protein ABIJ56_13350 [Pseudomonadota bacterium]|nr:hypothetical protein [Actinomycetota bacterium]
MTFSRFVVAASAAAALLAVSCGTEDVEINHQDADADTGGSDTVDELDALDQDVVPDVPDILDIPSSEDGMAFDWLDGYCGGMWIELTLLPTTIMLVVDRSSSMLEPSDGHEPTEDELGSCAETNAEPASGITFETRWDDVGGAVGSVADEYDDDVNFGLVLFPGPGALDGAITPELFCTGPVALPRVMTAPAEETAPAIRAVLDDPANNPVCSGGFTPADGGLAAAAGALEAVSEPGPGVIILATDGAPNCNASLPACSGGDCTTGTPLCDGTLGTIGCLDDAAAITTISGLHDSGVRTYVIGIPGSEGFASVLDAMAEAGGTARSGSPKYYEVGDGDELIEALGAITDSEISCVFELDSVPDNTNDINVLVDDSPLRRDDPDGFVYHEEDNTIELLGATCEDLKAGRVSDVKFLFGCEPFI